MGYGKHYPLVKICGGSQYVVASLVPYFQFENPVQQLETPQSEVSVYYFSLCSLQPEPTGVLPSNIGNPSGTITVDTSDFSEGTECIFYGCYMSSGLPFRSSLAIQPTSCVIGMSLRSA